MYWYCVTRESLLLPSKTKLVCLYSDVMTTALRRVAVFNLLANTSSDTMSQNSQ